MSRKPDLHGVQEVEQVAATWVFRREAGLTSDEAAEFVRWLDADPRHRAAVARQTSAWSALDRPRNAGQAKELWQRLAAREFKRRRRMGRIAVALVAFMAAGVFWRTQMVDRTAQPGASRTAVIRPEQKTLADGSIVELKAGAEFSVDFNGSVRRLILKKGEAHFDVKKNERPFIVAVGQVEFRAVGTAFVVQIAETAVELLVTEGQVAVEKVAVATEKIPSAPHAPVGPPEVLAMVGASARMVVRLEQAALVLPPTMVPPIEMRERLAWRAPKLEFTDTRLDEALKLMNQYNEIQFVIHDAALRELQVTGLFRADRTDAFIRLLEANFGVKAERSERTIGLRKR